MSCYYLGHHFMQIQENTFWTSDIFNNLITIIIALVAGLVALIQVKSNVISSSRINWIESMRASISDFCVNASYAVYLLHENEKIKKIGLEKSLKQSKLDQNHLGYLAAANEVSKCGIHIALHLDLRVEQHARLLELMNELDEKIHVSELSQDQQKIIYKDILEIQDVAKLVLEREFKKARQLFWLFKIG